MTGSKSKKAAAQDKLAQPAQQEPVTITNEMAFAFHSALTDGAIGEGEVEEIKAGLAAAFAHITTPPQRTEQNFCERCGKRTADLTVIHTCTPPQENT